MLKNIFLLELSTIRLLDIEAFTFIGNKRYIIARKEKDIFVDIYNGERYNANSYTDDELITDIKSLNKDMLNNGDTNKGKLRLIKR